MSYLDVLAQDVREDIRKDRVWHDCKTENELIAAAYLIGRENGKKDILAKVKEIVNG